jgi:hypothetical protein
MASLVLNASCSPTPIEYTLDTNHIVAAAAPWAITGVFPTVSALMVFRHMVQLQQFHIDSELFWSCSSQRNTSYVTAHRPMPWPSFMGIHADGDDVRPRPWPSFGGIVGCECSGDAIMKLSRRCTAGRSPMTPICHVIEFQISDFWGNLFASTGCIIVAYLCNSSEWRCLQDVLLFPGYCVSTSDCVHSAHANHASLVWLLYNISGLQLLDMVGSWN